jgi:hypothetical protein
MLLIISLNIHGWILDIITLAGHIMRTMSPLTDLFSSSIALSA